MKTIIFLFLFFIYPITLLERNIGSLIYPQDQGNCSNNIFASHRGYFNNGLYQDSSHQALKAAINEGKKHVEIDVNLVPGEIFLRHDSFDVPLLTSENIKRKYPGIMTFQEFVDIYSKSFQTVIVDIKDLNQSHDDAFRLFKKIRGAENFFFIGGSCRLLRKIQKELGWSSGCESQGVVANWALGMSLWSVNVKTITNFQIWLNNFFNLKSLFWTFHTLSQAKRFCYYKPDILLIDNLDK